MILTETIVKAYNYAKLAHEGQKRKFSDLDYFVHPKAVARLVYDYTTDEKLTVVALLHDVVEDTSVTREDIKKDFGEEICRLVGVLTNDSGLKGQSKHKWLLEDLKTMPIEVLIVKLCDRYHNVRYLDKDIKTKAQLDFIQKYVLKTIDFLVVSGKRITESFRLKKFNTRYFSILSNLFILIYGETRRLMLKFNIEPQYNNLTLIDIYAKTIDLEVNRK